MRMILVATLAIAPLPAKNNEGAKRLNGYGGKLFFHAKRAFSPLAMLGAAAYAGIRQESDCPTMAGSGIHSALAFALDSTLHQDPRYLRSGGTASDFWPDIQRKMLRKK